MKNISKLILLMIVAVVLFLQSCGTSTRANDGASDRLNVKMAKVQEVNQPRIFSYSGKLESSEHAVLSTRIMGNVLDVYVKPGQSVKKGQLLLQISDQDIRSKKSQIKAAQLAAEAAFINAEKDYQRFKTLFEQKSASQKELDDITTHYKMAKAQLNTAMEMEKELNETLKYASIRAPYSGMITKKFVNKGDMAAPGMPLLGIEQPKGFNVLARVPENDISCIEIGDEVNVKVAAANSQIKGKIIEVNASALLTGSQYEVKIKLDPSAEEKEILRSGMYANVFVEKGRVKAIMVPEDAIVYRGQLCGIYTVSQSNTVMLRWIRLGKQKGDMVEVISGLKAGESYVASCDGKICDGASVNLIK